MATNESTDGMEQFDRAIVEDDGERSIYSEGERFDADDQLRLTESEAEALLEYDRVVTRTAKNRKIILEIVPDAPSYAPVEIRPADDDCTDTGRDSVEGDQ